MIRSLQSAGARLRAAERELERFEKELARDLEREREITRARENRIREVLAVPTQHLNETHFDFLVTLEPDEFDGYRSALKARDRKKVDKLIEKFQAESANALSSLDEFARRAWNIVVPRPFVPTWHVSLINKYLMKLTHGEIENLLVNIAPATGKSVSTNVLWPAWAWAQDPSSGWLHVAYEEGLTLRDAFSFHRLITSTWFQRHWGDKVTLTKEAMGELRNDRLGWRLSTSIGGRVTGEHPQYICLPYDCLVTTNKGEIRIGDIVQHKLDVTVATMDEATGDVHYRDILSYQENPLRPFVEVRTTLGTNLRLTEDHRVVTFRGPIEAKRLQAGDEVVVFTGDFGVERPWTVGCVDQVVSSPGDDTATYNLNVNVEHNYFANGILVKNCCDDLQKAQDIDSEAKMRKAPLFYSTALSTRGITQERPPRVASIQQRLSVEDFSKFLLALGQDDEDIQIEHLCLPMTWRPDHPFLHPDDPRNDPAYRKKHGVLLCPKLLPPKEVRKVRKALSFFGEHTADAQLEQNPEHPSGGMFHRDVMLNSRIHETKINPLVFAGTICRAWDWAASEGQGDYTCGCLMGCYDSEFYVLDVTRFQHGPGKRDELIKVITKLDRLDYPNYTAVFEREPAAGGKAQNAAIIKALTFMGVVCDEVKGGDMQKDKVLRARPAAAAVNNGLFHFKMANWNDTVIAHLAGFPNMRSQDIGDSVAHACNWQISKNGISLF